MYPISQAKILKHAPAKLCISENWKKNNKVIDKEKAFLVAVWKGEGRKKKQGTYEIQNGLKTACPSHNESFGMCITINKHGNWNKIRKTKVFCFLSNCQGVKQQK